MKRRKEFRFMVTISAPINMTEAEARRELADLIPGGAYARMSGYKIASKRVQPMPGFVATYGEMGLEVEFFDNPARLREAVAEAESQYEADQLDSWTYDDRVLP